SEAVRLGRWADEHLRADARVPAVDGVADDVDPEERPVAAVPQRPLAEGEAVGDAIQRRACGYQARERRRRHVDVEHFGISARRVVRGYRDYAGPVRAVAPRVAGAALHDRVARLELHFPGVEHERDLAFEDEAEIEGARAAHRRAGEVTR